MKALLLLSLIAGLMAGCAVYTPSGAIVVDPASGGHCPPGQAKKGNC